MKMKRVSSALAKGLICKRSVAAMKLTVDPDKELLFSNQMELVKSCCCLEYRVNGSVRSEAFMTARTRFELIKFRL